MINYKIRDSDWLTFPLIIVNFNNFFIQPAPGLQQYISTLGLVSEYHEFFHSLYFVTNKQTYLTVGNGHHFSGEAWYMRSYKQTKLR